MAARAGGHLRFSHSRASTPLNSALLPVVALIIAAVAFAARRRARRRWTNRRISGGRKALVLNLFDRA
jgi:hypothetical protein